MPKVDLSRLKRIETRILYAGHTLEVFTEETCQEKMRSIFFKEYRLSEVREALHSLRNFDLVTETIGDDLLVTHYRLTKNGKGLVSEMRMAAQDVSNPHHLLTKPSNSPNIRMPA